jgi:hypothetical protein
MSGVLAVLSAGADPLLVWGLFARGLASIQLLALADCASQVVAFGGSRGIVPVAPTLRAVRRQLERPALRWVYTPTLLWLGDSDAALLAVPLAGAAAALVAITGVGGCSGLGILVANLCLLSLDCVFNLDKPWDHMLLELGWVGALLPTVLPLAGGHLAAGAPPHPAVAWAVRPAFPSWSRSIVTEIYLCRTCSCHEILRTETRRQVRWLLWRVMFGFGKLKFVGTDHRKDQLYIRDFMIAQPIPTRLGWLAHRHLPLCESSRPGVPGAVYVTQQALGGAACLSELTGAAAGALASLESVHID